MKTATKFLLFSYLLLLPVANIAGEIDSFIPYPVGELGSTWQFPSDHLPIGATVGNFHIAFWNILNKNYLFHIEENGQGLGKSSILKDNHPHDSSALTVRERIVVEQILEMIHHPSHPRSLIALEETHPDVLNALRKEIPSSWTVVTPLGQPLSQDVFLYDTTLFEFIQLEAVRYTPEQPKTIFSLTVQEKATGEMFRFVQSHIPGGPANSPAACSKFAQEAMRQFDPSLTIVLMGDMNQSPKVIEKALILASKDLPFQPYQHLPVAYPTHVNTRMEAAWIDNFFFYAPQLPVHASAFPEELCSAMDGVPPPMQKAIEMKHSKKEWKINTSNPGKLQEFQRLFATYGVSLSATGFDLDEIDADPLTVVAHKASQLEPDILLEDTSLDIEGLNVGVNVRWLMDHLKDCLGKKALCRVLLAYRSGDDVYIYQGLIEGIIVSAKGQGGFGFDPVFLPNGSDKTLAEFKPDAFNARALAVKAFIEDRKHATVKTIVDWEGPWQNSK